MLAEHGRGVPDGKITNPHARRLRREPSTRDQAGAKKPHTRPQPPPAERIEQVLKRRAASKVPDTERYRPKWLMALEMLDELAGWGLRPPLLTADAGYGQVTEFRQGLTERGIGYIVATTSSTTAHPGHAQPVQVPYAGVGKHPAPRYPHPARSLKNLARAHSAHTTRLVRWRDRQPTRERTPDRPTGELSGHFLALRVRPAGRAVQRGPQCGDDGVLPECWLLVQWPPGQDEPTDYWLSDLPADTPLTELVRLAKSRWRVEHDYHELKTALGLDHFEGRSWNGWHRHVTLTAAAQLFLTQERLTPQKQQGRPEPLHDPPRTAIPARDLARGRARHPVGLTAAWPVVFLVVGWIGAVRRGSSTCRSGGVIAARVPSCCLGFLSSSDDHKRRNIETCQWFWCVALSISFVVV